MQRRVSRVTASGRIDAKRLGVRISGFHASTSTRQAIAKRIAGRL
jgi:hypothetical protein